VQICPGLGNALSQPRKGQPPVAKQALPSPTQQGWFLWIGAFVVIVAPCFGPDRGGFRIVVSDEVRIPLAPAFADCGEDDWTGMGGAQFGVNENGQVARVVC
jgi:hypothetical protein